MIKYLLIILLPLPLFAFPNNSLDIGITMGGSYIQNETELPVFFNDTCCGKFNNGNSAGFFTGLAINYEFLPSFLFGDVRFLFDSRPANLSVVTDDYKVYDPKTDNYLNAELQNNFDVTLNYFVIDFGIMIQPIESIPILLRAGYDFSDASVTKEYSQTRSMVNPSGYLLNGKSIETVKEGDMNNLTVSQGLSGTLLGKIKLDRLITLTPEISYRHPINSSVENADWFTTMIRAGATINIALNEPEIIENTKIDTSTVQEEIIEEKEEENIVVLDKNVLNNIDVNEINLTETVVTQTYPILPYIFFDSTSSNLNSKYYFKGDVKRFSEQNLDKNSLRIYERVLDIIGSRMSESESDLTIKGYTDGVELTSTTERNSLAIARANTIKQYLINKWDISADRLKVEGNDLPPQPTSNLYNEGLAENRRVELIPEDINLLKPIIHSQFLEYASNENKLEVEIDANLKSIKDYTIIISDNTKQYYSDSKLTNPNEKINIPLDDKLIKSLAESDIDNLKVELIATTIDNRIETKRINLRINKENNDYELGRLNLIVFDFDKSIINEANKNMIDKFIVNHISLESEVDIYGSTDYLGEYKYNKELSQKRADNVAEYIKTLIPEIKYNNVKGLGSDNPKFDNTTPEGRFYCRTVLIEVKTPLKIN